MAISTKVIMDFLKVLSWQKIIQLLVFMTMMFVFWGLWENRITIYNTIKVGARVESDQPMVIQLSNSTKIYLETTLHKSKELVAGIQLVSVNFRKNSRTSSYFFFNNEALKNSFEIYTESKIADVPLFTDSEINNQRLINLVNGDFVCYDFKDTPGNKLFPPAGKEITVVCSISIPPYYGRFSGYMNLYLVKKPNNDEIVLIRQIARDTSLRIYEKDIEKNDAGKQIQ